MAIVCRYAYDWRKAPEMNSPASTATSRMQRARTVNCPLSVPLPWFQSDLTSMRRHSGTLFPVDPAPGEGVAYCGDDCCVGPGFVERAISVAFHPAISISKCGQH